jgi:alkanesulfonate monooxygenase SsuD/methylene tetrahydromethanopterin reductase-like flavin-dependent oxidoreductase (luciferase family)
MRIGVLPFSLGATFADLEQSWLAAEEAGFAALWTVDHSTPTSDLQPAWEASSLLVAMAARTRAIPIGVLVFDVLLRHPFIVAGSVAVAQALSRGRVQVGLGVGDKFSKLDHDALGLGFPPLDDRVLYLEACCTALPSLWRGETVTDPLLGLNDATLGPMQIEPPPLIIGGGRRGLMELAVRHAKGWNLFTQDPQIFKEKVVVLESIEASAARNEPLQKSVYLFVDRTGPDLPRVLKDFEECGAVEAMLVVRRPTRDAILKLGSEVL